MDSMVSFWEEQEWYICPCCGNRVYGKGRIRVDGEQPKVYVIHVEDDERDTSVVKVVGSQKEAEDYVRIHNESPGYSDVMFGNHYFWQAFTVDTKCPYKKPRYVRMLSTEPLRYYFTDEIPKDGLDNYGEPVITIEYHGLSGEN